jgi:hypothetical protein
MSEFSTKTDIRLMPLFDTKDVGPMVMEIPPAGPAGSITGSIDDGWQTALEDVGPAGVDKGNGGDWPAALALTCGSSSARWSRLPARPRVGARLPFCGG